MALVNEIEKLENYVTTAEQIKEKIKTTAENSGVTVENGDTPLSVLDKIGSELPSGENYAEWEAVNTQLEENIGDYANTPQKTLAQKIIDKSVTEITEWDLGDITTIGDYMFRDCKLLKKITFPNTITTIGDQAFLNCDALTTITLPDSIENIYSGAFQDCSYVTEVNVPNKNIYFGSSCLSRMRNLEEFIFPDATTTIEQQVFWECSNLKYVKLPTNISQLKSSTFYLCTSLPSIEIPANVTAIAYNCFTGCESLTEMTILATTPPTLASINAISTATTTIYVPAGSKTAYETADKWKDLLTRANPVTFVEIIDGSINVEGSIDTEDTTISGGGVEIGGGAIIGG